MVGVEPVGAPPHGSVGSRRVPPNGAPDIDALTAGSVPERCVGRQGFVAGIAVPGWLSASRRIGSRSLSPLTKSYETSRIPSRRQPEARPDREVVWAQLELRIPSAPKLQQRMGFRMWSSRRRTLLGYSAMLAVGIGIYFMIRGHGEGLIPPQVSSPERAVDKAGHTDALIHVMIALAIITLLARLMGGIFRRYLHQPPVIGEILAGLMLGPSLLGALSPAAYEFVLPLAIVPHLTIISKVGVVLFMFLVGLDLDPKLLRGHTHAMIAISHASIVVPFLLGATLALAYYPVYSTSNVSFTVFSLFMGISLSVTAFPVLARILVDRRVQHTPLGSTALSCAAVDDVTAWTLLALVAGIANAQMKGAAWTLLFVLLYIAAMFLVVKPLVAGLVARQQIAPGPLSHTVLAIVFTALLMSAVTTEAIGIHALFGAFLLGTILPHEGRLAEQLRARLEDFVLVFLLPCFFVLTGMRTEVGLLDSFQDWLACLVVIIVATLGKFGGSAVAARLAGMSWRRSAALGILMNTRGLMELVVLNLGLDMGVITPKVFTMMVLMALVTTFSTTPILDLLLGRQGFEKAVVPPEGAALASGPGSSGDGSHV